MHACNERPVWYSSNVARGFLARRNAVPILHPRAGQQGVGRECRGLHARHRFCFTGAHGSGEGWGGPAAAPVWKEQDAMAMTGTVKFFNTEKGYGFIRPDDGGRDVFVHVSAVTRSGLGTLAEGQRVSFEVEPDKRGKGPKAIDLQPAD